MRVGILRAQRRDPLESEARGGVHRKIKNDQLRFAKCGFIKRLARKIETADGMSVFAEPGRGRSQAKRLAAEFIGAKQENFHGTNSIARGLEPQKNQERFLALLGMTMSMRR